MKRNRLKGTTNHTLTQKREALKELSVLQAKGLSLNQARIQIGAKYSMTPSGIAYWQKTVNKVKKAKKSVKLAKTNHVVTRHSNTTINGLETMKSKLGVVFESLCDKDGKYDHADAKAIASIAGNIIGTCRQVLLERKFK